MTRILLTRPDVPGFRALDEAAARLDAEVVRLPGTTGPDAAALREAPVGVDAVLAPWPAGPAGSARRYGTWPGLRTGGRRVLAGGSGGAAAHERRPRAEAVLRRETPPTPVR